MSCSGTWRGCDSPSSLSRPLNLGSMAQATGSPDAPTRSLPAWAAPEVSPTTAEAIRALESYKKKDPSKSTVFNGHSFSRDKSIRFSTVVVRFKAVGNAPIMKQNFYKITSSNRFQAVIQFLRRELGWKAGDPLVRFCWAERQSYRLIL